MDIEKLREMTASQKDVLDSGKVIEYREKLEEWIKEWAMKGRNCCAYPYDGFWDKPYLITVAEELKRDGFTIEYDKNATSGNINIGW